MKLGNINELMKQAQSMQENMQKMQEEVAKLEVTGNAGAGLVTIVMNGRHDVRDVKIDVSLLKDATLDENREMLEDLIAAAINDAVRKLEFTQQEKMKKLTGGLQLPPGFKMPF